MNASLAGGTSEFTRPEQLMYVIVRLWTSALRLGRHEFCSILNLALIKDDAQTMAHTAMITQAGYMPLHAVTRRHMPLLAMSRRPTAVAVCNDM